MILTNDNKVLIKYYYFIYLNNIMGDKKEQEMA